MNLGPIHSHKNATTTTTDNDTHMMSLPDGTRYGHASVQLPNGIIVVTGGVTNAYEHNATSSVWILVWMGTADVDSTTNKTPTTPYRWISGPPLCEAREKHALVYNAATQHIYAIGGYNDDRDLDTMECLDVAPLLLEASLLAMTTNAQDNDNDDDWITALFEENDHDNSANRMHWTTLHARLSCPRTGCAAVSIQTAIVIMGGWDGLNNLASVEVLNVETHELRPGPSMLEERWCFGAVVVKNGDDNNKNGTTIYVVGGKNNAFQKLRTVESLCFKDNDNDDPMIWDALEHATWVAQPDLSLHVARHGHATTLVEEQQRHEIVVAGGSSEQEHLCLVEVLDLSARHVRCGVGVPNLQAVRKDGTAHTLLPSSNNNNAAAAAVLLFLGGVGLDSMELMSFCCSPSTLTSSRQQQQDLGHLRALPILARKEEEEIGSLPSSPEERRRHSSVPTAAAPATTPDEPMNNLMLDDKVDDNENDIDGSTAEALSPSSSCYPLVTYPPDNSGPGRSPVSSSSSSSWPSALSHAYLQLNSVDDEPGLKQQLIQLPNGTRLPCRGRNSFLEPWDYGFCTVVKQQQLQGSSSGSPKLCFVYQSGDQETLDISIISFSALVQLAIRPSENEMGNDLSSYKNTESHSANRRNDEGAPLSTVSSVLQQIDPYYSSSRTQSAPVVPTHQSLHSPPPRHSSSARAQSDSRASYSAQEPLVAAALPRTTTRQHRPKHYFLSHSGHDKAIVLCVARLLHKYGHDFWLDILHCNDSNIQSIYSAISQCDCFLAIVSNSFKRRDWPMKELGFAEGIGKPIVCLRLEKPESDDPNAMFFKQHPGTSTRGTSPASEVFECFDKFFGILLSPQEMTDLKDWMEQLQKLERQRPLEYQEIRMFVIGASRF